MHVSEMGKKPFRLEEVVLAWCARHVEWIVFGVVSLMGMVMRTSMLSYESADYTAFLTYWYDDIKANGGLLGLGTTTGNYNALYQFLIACMTYLPIPKLLAYKLFSIIGDYCLALCSGLLAYSIRGGKRGLRQFVLAYSLVLLSPLVAINSAAWAQCDSLWTAFCIGTLVCIKWNHPRAAFALYGIAFAFKLQAIFLVPVLLLIWARDRSFSLACMLEVPLVMVVCALPAIIEGMPLSKVFGIYSEQVDYYDSLSMNYPSFWSIVTPPSVTDSTDVPSTIFHNSAIALTIGVVMLEVWALLRGPKSISPRNYRPEYIRPAALTVYTVVAFLPTMHERYSYMAGILLLIACTHDWRMAPIALVEAMLSLTTYGTFLFGSPILDFRFLSAVNIANLLALALLVLRFPKPAKATARGK